MEYDKRVTIRLSAEDRLRLATRADAMGMSIGDVIRDLLHKWFEKKVSIAKSDKDLE